VGNNKVLGRFFDFGFLLGVEVFEEVFCPHPLPVSTQAALTPGPSPVRWKRGTCPAGGGNREGGGGWGEGPVGEADLGRARECSIGCIGRIGCNTGGLRARGRFDRVGR
jgi:hypothetical protein